MNAAVLDTLRCARTLQTAGFPPAQAEAMAQVLADALSDVATKADLDNAVGSLESRIALLDQKFDFLRDEIKNQARLTLIILSAIVTLFLGAIVALSFPWGAPATAPPQAAESTIPTPDAQAAPQPKPPGAPPPSSQPAST